MESQQQKNIATKYKELKEERIVTSKDVALNWIQSIGNNYDGATTIQELHNVIDELVVYAMLGSEQLE